ncbi:hypothetical protein [Sulfurirhabdus autotrophica]|nr:hypothetical protein [Sulfurirhabdus autotrophica]
MKISIYDDADRELFLAVLSKNQNQWKSILCDSRHIIGSPIYRLGGYCRA